VENANGHTLEDAVTRLRDARTLLSAGERDRAAALIDAVIAELDARSSVDGGRRTR
jgi:hypothetical protein